MKIIAVVVTYNRLELLKQSVASLRNNSPLSQIVVVNNGATDGTHEWLDAQSDILTIHQSNVGGSGGFYTGIAKAYEMGADWIWCMDDDVFPRQDCLQQLLDCLGKDIGILAPRRILNGQPFIHEFTSYNFTNPLLSMKRGKLHPSISVPTDIAGCDFEGPFISRQVVERIGLPNKDFFIFCDDTDYCLRAYLAGFRLCYVPTALMDKQAFFSEDSWASRQQKKKWKRYYQVRNEAYMNHHYGKNFAVRYGRSLMGLAGYVAIALCSMPFSKAWKWKDISRLYQAYRDGINERLGRSVNS